METGSGGIRSELPLTVDEKDNGTLRGTIGSGMFAIPGEDLYTIDDREYRTAVKKAEAEDPDLAAWNAYLAHVHGPQNEADHRDDYLTDEDRESLIQVCVSRAMPGETLELDL